MDSVSLTIILFIIFVGSLLPFTYYLNDIEFEEWEPKLNKMNCKELNFYLTIDKDPWIWKQTGDHARALYHDNCIIDLGEIEK